MDVDGVAVMDHRTRVRVIEHFASGYRRKQVRLLGHNFRQFNDFTGTRSRIYSLIGSNLLLNIPYWAKFKSRPLDRLCIYATTCYVLSLKVCEI